MFADFLTMEHRNSTFLGDLVARDIMYTMYVHKILLIFWCKGPRRIHSKLRGNNKDMQQLCIERKKYLLYKFLVALSANNVNNALKWAELPLVERLYLIRNMLNFKCFYSNKTKYSDNRLFCQISWHDLLKLIIRL